MIEIIPFNRTLFSSFTIDKNKLNKYTYITNIDLISKLLIIDLPIKNRRLALINILDFLHYIDNYKKDNNTVIMHRSIIEKYFSRNKYKEYMDILSKLNVINKISYKDEVTKKDIKVIKNDSHKKDYSDKNLFYIPGSKSTTYKLSNNYVNDENLCIVILEDDKKDFEFICEVEDLNEKFIKTIRDTHINIQRAIGEEIINFEEKGYTMSRLKKRISNILSTIRNRYIKKGKKVDRIYHSFTNVSKIARRNFNISFYNIDVVNCQPLLLAAFLKKENLLIDDNYINDCENGLFYERFYELYGKNEKDNELVRDYTKVSLYSTIFFNFKEKRLHNKLFKKLYPNTWLSIKEINDRKETLASKLQNLEASFFNMIIPEYSEYYFTLFDAVYFTEYVDKIIIEEKLKNYFNQYGVRVKTK